MPTGSYVRERVSRVSCGHPGFISLLKFRWRLCIRFSCALSPDERPVGLGGFEPCSAPSMPTGDVGAEHAAGPGDPRVKDI